MPPRAGADRSLAVTSATRPTVLVAENDEDNRFMLRVLLEMKGYRVVEARDGQEAIEVAQTERPGLILTDLQMPRLGGFAITRYLRQHPQLRKVPIVVVSGHDPTHHRTLALAAGCTAYLVKPIDFDHLEKLLSDLLPLASRSPICAEDAAL